MRYAFPQLNTKTRFQSYNIVRRVLERFGHTVTADIDSDTDVVLFSACDVTDMVQLRALRRKTDKPIVCGGSYAFNYWSAKAFSDIVWIGEIFEFAECKTLDEVAGHRSAYTGDDSKRLFASQRIDWELIPITQFSPKKIYYLGAVGCSNKCRFCFTSWTHRHQVNDIRRINAAIAEGQKRKLHLMICANEYTFDVNVPTKDMLLVDYIKIPVTGQFVRLGVEFATEATRKRMGKPITRDELYAAVQKMNIDNIALRLFHITGYDTREDWERYIDDMCAMLSAHPNRRMLHLEFNNLQYQNYTPLYEERYKIDPARYTDINVSRGWYDRLRQYSRHVLVGAPSPFKHVACRTGIELGRTHEQVNYWLTMLSRKAKLTNESAYRALMESDVLSTKRRKLNFRTGEIIVCDN